jgi:wobble nucleotide-excising tRNase
MIESISIANVATYPSTPEKLTDLRQLNFLFGSNGTGKTTVSRIIAEESAFPTCSVTWRAGTKLQTLVYNHDFVERNFNQPAQFKGVFTLGEQQLDTLAKITTAKSELDAITKKIETLTETLQGTDGTSGKKGELATLESSLKDKCWIQKQKHDAKLWGGFEGYRSSSEKFKIKVLQELSSNTAGLMSLADLEKKAESVFGSTPAIEQAIPAITTTELIAHETNPILQKRIIGKEDVDIAAMIKKLGNSDWVKQGRSYYDGNGGTCPFCQQSTNAALTESLNEYFDETFVADIKLVAELASKYSIDSSRLQQQISSIIATSCKFLDIDKLKIEKELLDSRITINNQRIAEKKKESSQVAALEPLGAVIDAISVLIDSANAQVSEHNVMVSNLSNEKATLTSQIWKYVLEELKVDIASYKTSRDALERAIAGITAQIQTSTTNKATKSAEIRELEKLTTSIQPTIDGINALLASFGFQGFKLAKANTGTSYVLLRQDGSDAKATLSEGEKTFVTFLYFYHLLKGSASDSGITTDKIVVFDDPVSSLDSDILFIVSSIIKGLFNEVRDQTGHIKQIFVSTHNVYFHKEVTYNPKRGVVANHDETFWVVRKPGLTSMVQRHPTNPIKTSYELLWAEVRKADRSNLSVQNTLRRILENYFKILGSIDFDDLCNMFDGREKLLCKSLCSWVHDGSHYAHDDLFVSIEETMVEAYLKVFRAIFYKAGHSSHYRMMMGDDFVEEPSSNPLGVQSST